MDEFAPDDLSQEQENRHKCVHKSPKSRFGLVSLLSIMVGTPLPTSLASCETICLRRIFPSSVRRTGWFVQQPIIRGLNEPPRLRPLRRLRDFLLLGAATPPFAKEGSFPLKVPPHGG